MHVVAKIDAFGKSDIGNKRQNNEDVFALLPEYGFFVLADGMGGHNGGEIAAHEAVAYLCRSAEELTLGLEAPTAEQLAKDMHDMLVQCNSYVHHIGKTNITLEGMGTTLCTALILGDTLIHAHIGDSRIYLYRDGDLRLLTRDHSLINKLIDTQKMSEKKARETVSKSSITRAIGRTAQVEPEIDSLTLLEGDRLFLCSDGLTDQLTHDEMERLLHQGNSLEETTNHLITLAKSKGGSDNITIIMVNYVSRQ